MTGFRSWLRWPWGLLAMPGFRYFKSVVFLDLAFDIRESVDRIRVREGRGLGLEVGG
jgi:hypothetical protein